MSGQCHAGGLGFVHPEGVAEEDRRKIDLYFVAVVAGVADPLFLVGYQRAQNKYTRFFAFHLVDGFARSEPRVPA